LKRKKKKESLPKLRKKALKLWAKVVKSRVGNKCEVCGIKNGELNKNGKKTWINAHHIEDKMNYSTRFCVKNGVALCPSCHKFSKNSAHRSPVWFLNWLYANKKDIMEYIMEARDTNPSKASDWSMEMMKELMNDLQNKINELENNYDSTAEEISPKIYTNPKDSLFG